MRIEYEHTVTRIFRKFTAGVGLLLGGVLSAAAGLALIPAAIISLPGYILVRQDRNVTGGLMMAPGAIAMLPGVVMGGLGLAVFRRSAMAMVDAPTLMYAQVLKLILAVFGRDTSNLLEDVITLEEAVCREYEMVSNGQTLYSASEDNVRALFEGKGGDASQESFPLYRKANHHSKKRLVLLCVLIGRFALLRECLRNEIILAFVGPARAGKTSCIRALFGADTSSQSTNCIHSYVLPSPLKQEGESSVPVRLSVVEFSADHSILLGGISDISTIFVCIFPADNITPDDKAFLQALVSKEKEYIVLINKCDVLGTGWVDCESDHREKFSRLLDVPTERIFFASAQAADRVDAIRCIFFAHLRNFVKISLQPHLALMLLHADLLRHIGDQVSSGSFAWSEVASAAQNLLRANMRVSLANIQKILSRAASVEVCKNTAGSLESGREALSGEAHTAPQNEGDFEDGLPLQTSHRTPSRAFSTRQSPGMLSSNAEHIKSFIVAILLETNSSYSFSMFLSNLVVNNLSSYEYPIIDSFLETIRRKCNSVLNNESRDIALSELLFMCVKMRMDLFDIYEALHVQKYPDTVLLKVFEELLAKRRDCAVTLEEVEAKAKDVVTQRPTLNTAAVLARGLSMEDQQPLIHGQEALSLLRRNTRFTSLVLSQTQSPNAIYPGYNHNMSLAARLKLFNARISAPPYHSGKITVVSIESKPELFLASVLGVVNDLSPAQLRGDLVVRLSEEAAVDAKGVLRSVFSQIGKLLSEGKFPFFESSETGDVFFSPFSGGDLLAGPGTVLHALGRIIGIALHNCSHNVLLSASLPLAIFKLILGRSISLDDLPLQDVARSVRQLCLIPDNEVDDLSLTFDVSSEDGRIYPLVPGASGRPVTSLNRFLYLETLVMYYLGTTLPLDELVRGVADVVSPELLTIFSPAMLKV